jgi:hypothetical protein
VLAGPVCPVIDPAERVIDLLDPAPEESSPGGRERVHGIPGRGARKLPELVEEVDAQDQQQRTERLHP